MLNMQCYKFIIPCSRNIMLHLLCYKTIYICTVFEVESMCISLDILHSI